ncbi:MAG: hypothetical protein H7X92_02125 [Chitinophagales bacterium]|nr:hypothetical protein [Hyphomicrobiales bacterium]
MSNQNRKVKLRTWLIGVLTVLLFAPGLISGLVYTSNLHESAELYALNIMRDRGQLSADQLARRMHRLWSNIERLSMAVTLDDKDALRAQLEQIVKVDDRFTWLGVAWADGQVFAASGSMLEGNNVSSRPWFRQGLQGPFAGDVHEAVLLAKALPVRAEPYRFVDFAAPIKDREGKTVAVVGAHFDWSWVRETLSSLKQGQTDILLLSRDNVVLYGPESLEEKRLLLDGSGAGGKIGLTSRIETWADGRDYITDQISEIRHGNLPSFGWKMLVRQDAHTAFQPLRRMAQQFWLTVGIGAATALAGIFVLTSWIVRPVQNLSNFANHLANGKLAIQPPEEKGYFEATQLSNALTKLQSTLIRSANMDKVHRQDQSSGLMSELSYEHNTAA